MSHQPPNRLAFAHRRLQSRLVWGFIIGLCSLGSFAGWANEQPTLRQEVEELIQKFDASTLAERTRAEKRLLELGPEILPLLPPPDLIEEVTAREAIRRIRPLLERQAARESAAASRVTLQGTHSLKEIVDELQRQTKNRVTLGEELRRELEQPITTNWSDATFWVCLDDLCDRYRLSWQFRRTEPVLEIAARTTASPSSAAIHRTGPFRLALVHAEIRPVIGSDDERILRVNGQITIEPRLRPLFLWMDAAKTNATSEDGTALRAWNPDAKYEFPLGDGGREASIQWDLQLPKGADPKTVTIQGKLLCEIAAATERIAFDRKALAAGVVRRRGGVSVRMRRVAFEAVDPLSTSADIAIAVTFDHGGPAFESHRTWILHNAAYLETTSSSRLEFTNFDTTQQADGAVAIDYHWAKLDAPAEDYRFIYEAPTLIISVPVEFEVGPLTITR